MAETKCASWRSNSVPVWLVEKGLKALVCCLVPRVLRRAERSVARLNTCGGDLGFGFGISLR